MRRRAGPCDAAFSICHKNLTKLWQKVRDEVEREEHLNDKYSCLIPWRTQSLPTICFI